MSAVVTQGEGFEVLRVDACVFVLRISGHLSRTVMTATLEAIWAMPEWEQPWGLVVSMQGSAGYERDILGHEMPPDDRRAVGTAVATANVFHRMIVKSIGIGLRLASRFQLSGHETEDEAIAHMTARVLEVRAHDRKF